MSFFRGLFAVVVMLSVAIFSTGAFAAVPLTLTHQGRLLDATDKPVNGVFDVTYRIFEVPTGGSPLWTEVHPSVPVADGLFSALLGSTVTLSPDVLGSDGGGGGVSQTRYLEVSVGGTTLAPRLALSSAPSAISTGHVSGDIETAPGRFTVTNTGSATTGALSCRATPDSVVLDIHHDSDGDGFLNLNSTADQSELHIARKRPGRVKYSNLTLRVMPDSLSDYRDTDSDDDGVPESQFSQRLTPTTSSVAIKTKGTGAANNKAAACSAIASIPIVGGALASLVCTIDDDGDGVPETSVSSSCDASSASQVMEKKGLNAVNVKLARTISSPPGGLLAVDALDMDSDDDGVMDKSISSSCDATGARLKVNNIGSSGEDGVELLSLPTSSSMAIKTKGTGAAHNRSITSTTDPEDATIVLEADTDGDGHPDFTIADSVGTAGASRKLQANNLGSSGQDGVELSVKPTGSGVAIKTKGTGAEANRVLAIQSGTAPTGVSSVCSIDDDGDSVPEGEISQILTPTTSGVAIKTKGTGANDNRSASLVCAADLDGDGTLDRSVSTTADSTTAGIAIDEPGVQIGMKVVNKGVVKGVINIASANRMIELDSDGNGFFASKIGVGKDPIEKIDVQGGAYCDGTNWVNASDRNSKENFTAVDGNELLDQIAQLSITRWNYKGNNQAEHIGPTAQDFKAAFGVGANDKTISTIDPSGIALAAIKALNSKMQELNAKTSQLEDQAREITQLKAELDAIKAMLQKQAVTKN